MADDKPCPYCGTAIREGRRGVRLDQRKTCGSPGCQKLHHKSLAVTWVERNPTYHRDFKRVWRRGNERERAVNAAWWDANRQYQYEINKKWRAANRERHQQLIREWERSHPAARAGYSANRRGWKQTGEISESDWLRLVNRYDGRCAYCTSDDPLTVDHVVPLSRGGRHTIGNVLPACRSCNSAKQDKFLVEWRSGRCHGRGRSSTTSGRRSDTK